MEKKRVLVVGGGAAGLAAGIMAAREGAAVTVLEQNEKPGKKICATGNGKCNFTNLHMPEDAFRGTHPEFVKDILAQFSVEDTVGFFEELGIYAVNRNGYLYPRSGQASSVAEVLCMEARNRRVKIKTRERVTGLWKEGALWKVQTEGWTYEGEAVILANGSRASAISGSEGSGYLLAKSLGHSVIEPLPALCALKCKGKHFSAWSGVRAEGTVTLCINGRPFKSEHGEIQLTDYGVSGIPVFQLSRYAVRALHKGDSVALRINFLPEFSGSELDDFLETRRKNCPYKNNRELLVGLFPEKLGKILCSQPVLTSAIREFPLTVIEGMPFSQAQVCSGGVDTHEVNGTTLESKLHRGLYFAGELLDIDGTCGGYNLQWAWSSGTAAGRHAAKEQL